jgi:PIN domain nuclease of toxin-antitoxin system
MKPPLVYDASALLAVLYAEPGAARVLDLLDTPNGIISAVNWSEVAAKLAERGMQQGVIARELAVFGLDVVPFDEAQALLAAALRPTTRALGLSLGDRACLALAQLHGTQAVTADTTWQQIPAVAVIAVR